MIQGGVNTSRCGQSGTDVGQLLDMTVVRTLSRYHFVSEESVRRCRWSVFPAVNTARWSPGRDDQHTSDLCSAGREAERVSK